MKTDVQIQLQQMFPRGEYEELAKHPQLALAPARIRGTLAATKDWRVRESLALNPALARFPETAAWLSTDIDHRVRSCLASNPAFQQHGNTDNQLK